MNRFFNTMITAALLLTATTARGEVLSLTLEQAIDRARLHSVEAAVALDELRQAYWEYRTFRSDLLPEVSFNATLPSYRKQYTSYMNEEGSYSFVRNNYLQMNGELSVSQNIWLTGGTLSLNSSLDFIRDLEGNGQNRFMSIPVALTLDQPIFGVNRIKWNRRIEPERYAEAKAAFLSATENVALTAINNYFNLVMARENLGIARQNLENASKLYDVAKVKRQMGQISENDLLQMELNLLDARRRQLEADYAVAQAKGDLREIRLFAQVGYTGTAAEFQNSYRGLRDNQVVEIGVKIPLLDWGKRRGKVKVAESNRRVVESRLRQENMNFNQDLFLLVERFSNQQRQLDIAMRADTIALRRYDTNVETFMIGRISTLDLNDSQLKKDQARQNLVNQLYQYWHYYYQLRSLTLWDYARHTDLNADFDRLLRN